jgi:hypothetical protein
MVAHDIVVTLLCEELHSEAPDVPNGVGTSLFTTSGADSGKNWGLLANSIEELGRSKMGDIMSDFEFSPGTGGFGMDNPRGGQHKC